MSKIVKKQDRANTMDLAEQVRLEESTEPGLVPEPGKVIRRDVAGASAEAHKIIEEARAEATRIRRQASDLLSRVSQESERARNEGFEKGREEGLAQATEFIFAARREKETMYDGLESEMIKLVYDIAEKVIGRELAERDTAIVDLIKQALQASMGSRITVIVNPEDYESVKTHQGLLLSAIEATKTIQIRSDDKVSPHGCLIETEVGTIDAQLETQLAAIRKALGLEGV